MGIKHKDLKTVVPAEPVGDENENAPPLNVIKSIKFIFFAIQ